MNSLILEGVSGKSQITCLSDNSLSSSIIVYTIEDLYNNEPYLFSTTKSDGTINLITDIYCNGHRPVSLLSMNNQITIISPEQEILVSNIKQFYFKKVKNINIKEELVVIDNIYKEIDFIDNGGAEMIYSIKLEDDDYYEINNGIKVRSAK